jgi:hypothetical protein
LQTGQQRGSDVFAKFCKQVEQLDPFVAGHFKQYGTKQGVYAMTPEGDYLAATWGGYTRQKAHVLGTLNKAIGKWREMARERGLSPPKPIVRKAGTTWGES